MEFLAAGVMGTITVVMITRSSWYKSYCEWVYKRRGR